MENEEEESTSDSRSLSLHVLKPESLKICHYPNYQEDYIFPPLRRSPRSTANKYKTPPIECRISKKLKPKPALLLLGSSNLRRSPRFSNPNVGNLNLGKRRRFEGEGADVGPVSKKRKAGFSEGCLRREVNVNSNDELVLSKKIQLEVDVNEKCVSKNLLTSSEKTVKSEKSGKREKIIVCCFVGEPMPEEEAQNRWKWRYELKRQRKGQSWKINAGKEDEIILNVECHYAQARVGSSVLSIGDCVYVKGDGKTKHVGRILEFFKTMDGQDYFRVQWFFHAEDTVLKDAASSHDKRRLFYSTLKNDNILDCIISKVNVVKVTPTRCLKSNPVRSAAYYYDMEYCVEYSTFQNLSTESSDSLPLDYMDIDEKQITSTPLAILPNFENFKPKLALLDLYSGCGGMSTGLCVGAKLSNINLVTQWAVDCNQSACYSLKLNHLETHVRNEPAENFLELLRRWEKLCKLHACDLERTLKYELPDLRKTKSNTTGLDAKVSSGEYEVSSLVDICYGDPCERGKNGLHFKVRWKGYDPEDDTWERIEGLSNCQEKIREFVRKGFKSKILPLPGDVDVICGGPPCQGISGYNRYRNTDSPLSDKRNRQIVIFMDIVEFLNPKYVLMENVVDIIRFDKGSLGRYALSRLVRMRYQARLGTIASGCYGLPQFRLRVFIWAAHPTLKLPQFPLPTHDVIAKYYPPLEFERNIVAYDESHRPTLEEAILLRESISDLPEVKNDEDREEMPYQKLPETEFQTYIRLTKNEMFGLQLTKDSDTTTSTLYDHRPSKLSEHDYLRVCQIPHRKGANFRDLPGVVVGEDNVARRDPTKELVMLPTGRPLVPDCLFTFEHGKSRKPYGRLWWDETVSTIVTFPYIRCQAILHPEQDRLLTIRECARLQGFPDFYRFCGTIKERYCQIGNAVSIPVSRALGYALGMAYRHASGDEPLMTLPSKFFSQRPLVDEKEKVKKIGSVEKCLKSRTVKKQRVKISSSKHDSDVVALVDMCSGDQETGRDCVDALTDVSERRLRYRNIQLKIEEKIVQKEKRVSKNAILSIEKTVKSKKSEKREKIIVCCFVGESMPEEEAQKRWKWRYELKSQRKGKSGNINAGEEDEIILNVDCHYAQAKVGSSVLNIGDCVYVKGEGKTKHVGRILEFFKTKEGEDYFRVQWFFHAKDTVLKDTASSHDKRRLFYSTVKNDNILDCIISKVNVVKVPPMLCLKSNPIQSAAYYYDMEYCMEYSTFKNLSTETSTDCSNSVPLNCMDLDDKQITSTPLGKLALLDLYSGCGGMSTGLCVGSKLSNVNLVTKWAVDFNQSACDSLKLNHPETHVRNEPAENFLELLRRWEKLCKLHVSDLERELNCELLDLRKSENNTNRSDAEVSSGEYEVLSLVDICYGDPCERGKNGLHFKVRWKGFGPEDDTWEPSEGLSNCQEKINEFVRNGFKSKILPLPGDVDVICGGPPCQGISGYNRYRNTYSPLSDEKNRQIVIFMDIVEFLNPKYVLMENVVDIIRFDKGSLGRYALSRLVRMRYQARLGTIASGSYGLPQFRLRVFIWAAHPSLKLPQFPLPTHDVLVRYYPPLEFERNIVAYDEGHRPTLKEAILLRDSISDLPEVENDEDREEMPYRNLPETEFQTYIRLTKNEIFGLKLEATTSTLYDHRPFKLSEHDYLRVCQIPHRKGANFRDLDGVVVGEDNVARRDPTKGSIMLPTGRLLVPDCVLNFEHGKSRKPYGRLWWDETVSTIVTFPYVSCQTILHPEQDRLLTIRECARLQGFPDFYRFCGTIKERYCQIGNAVSIPVSRALGYALGMAYRWESGDEPLMTLPANFFSQRPSMNDENL